MVELVIVRGIPGAGKSTYAKKIYPNHALVEADQYFMRNGEYLFDKTKLHYAHTECFDKVQYNLLCGTNVVVANTFIKRRDITKYLEIMFLIPTLEVTIVELHTSFMNTHSVPAEKVYKMKSDWEEIPVYWKVKLIKVE